MLLEPVLRLLVKYVTDPRFGQLVCDIAVLVIDMYGSVLGQSPLIDSLVLRLRKKIIAEIRFQKELVKAKAALNMILATTNPSVTC
jgi:U3 small nucleolar RNA-associated protein 15